MVKQSLIFCLLFCLCKDAVLAQECTAIGQTPASAFPVCGTDTFHQGTVPICSTVDLFVPGCSSNSGGADYQNKNPSWYKFTCYQSGTLGFTITPIDGGDDYDWQLYDVTGLDPNEVYTNHNIIVSGNWAGTYGATGAQPGGISYIQCASDPASNLPSFATMPEIIIGHKYLLLISHFTNSQSGYSLSFNNGSAVITDPKLPALLSGDAACDAMHINILLNKDMKCSSLAANGSDFSINAAGINITGAASAECARGFDMNTIELTLDNPLPPGTFTVTCTIGSDNNTLLDNCDRGVTVGDNVTFTVYPLAPTSMDSITPVKCAPQTLELVFKKSMLCSSIAADGSDFEIIGGPVPVTVSGASGVSCAAGLSKKIQVRLSAPVQVGGTYTIRLKNGTDGNTISDECSQQTPAGSVLSFVAKDTVNADFTYSIAYGCAQNIIQYNHNGANGVNRWTWNFDSTRTSTLQNPLIAYTNYRQKITRLIVTNGVCSDTSKVTIFFDNLLEADFEITGIVCPNDPAKIINTSVGRIIEWNWSFGNGATGSVRNPLPQYYAAQPSADYIASPKLIVKNDYGCYDTISKPVKVVYSCYIAVPTAFTPNGDGVNDYLYPLSAYKAVGLEFSVYNRFGERLFYTTDWTKKWDGRYKGQGADPGTYVWMLSYTNSETNRKVFQKGTTVLIR